jgi:hypothetical protein
MKALHALPVFLLLSCLGTGALTAQPAAASAAPATLAPPATVGPAASPTKVAQPGDPKTEGPRKATDFGSLMKDFQSGDFWWTLCFALVFGGLGGLVYELLVLQGQIEIPHKATATEGVQGATIAIWSFSYDLGIFARVIIGAFAAVAILWAFTPPSGLALLSTSLIAGSAGSSIFRSLSDRLLAVISQKDAADTRKKADVMNQKVEAADKNLGDASAKMKPTIGAGAAMSLSDQKDAHESLQAAIRAIGDARAIYETIKKDENGG